MPNFDPIRTETGWRVELDALALEVDNPHGDAGVIRAVLTIWRNGVIHYRDRVNLTSAKTRARLIAKLADKNIVLDERVLVALDEVCRRPPPEAEVDPEDVDAQRRTAWFLCADLARDTRILDRVAAVVRQIGLVGEERAVKLLYLIVSSRLLDKPISVALKGPSSVGKSFLVEQVLTLFPPSAFHALSAMSERALAYDDEPVAHRMLVLYEAAGLQGDFASYLARSLLSEGRISYTTVEKTKDGLRPRHIEREGPTGLIATTTALKLHPENETRLLSLAITDTPEQTAAVLKKLAEERSNTADLAPWHALQTWLETAEHRVVIPYAPVLAKMIPPIAVRLRRDFGAVLNLVRAHALLLQQSRTRNTEGRIVATLEDYGVVRQLVHDLVADGVEAAVSKTIRETVEAVASLHAVSDSDVAVVAVARTLGLDKSAAWRRVQVALAKGYLKNLEDRKYRPARLVPGEGLPDDEEVLPTVEALETKLKEEGCRVAGDSRGTDTPPSSSEAA